MANPEKIIREQNDIHDTWFTVSVKAGKNELTDVIRYHYEKHKADDGTPIWLFYDSSWDFVPEMCRYLNRHCLEYAHNTVLHHISALKLLFTFESIIGKKIMYFSKSDTDMLKRFLLGIDISGNGVRYELKTERQPATVNGYLSVYREYMKFLKVTNPFLNEKSDTARVYAGVNEATLYRGVRYKSSLSNKDHLEREISFRITPSQYRDMLKLVNEDPKYKKYRLFADVLIHCMMQYGLRIGEALGLTNEDIRAEKYISNSGKEYIVYYMYLRNRTTDHPVWQHAKTCMRPEEPREYHTRAYNLEGDGFQRVSITKSFYDKLHELMDANAKFTKKKTKTRSKVAADSVFAKRIKIGNTVRILEDPNFYLFLNTQGGKLTYKRWGQILRDIFRDLDIPLDTGVKQHNLSHRFRHGFAMWLVQIWRDKGDKYDEEKLAKRMRHATTDTCKDYLRLSSLEKSDILEAFEKANLKKDNVEDDGSPLEDIPEPDMIAEILLKDNISDEEEAE